MFDLVTVERITEINPIQDALNVEQAIVNGHSVVVPLGLHQVGDLVVHYKPCFIPRKGFSFLENYATKIDNYLAYRVRRINILGTESYGFILPLRRFYHYIKKYFYHNNPAFLVSNKGLFGKTEDIKLCNVRFKEGDDVTSLAKAINYPRKKNIFGLTDMLAGSICEYPYERED